MPCLCGDIYCESCGYAQGNWKCPLCRAWASDGCEHISEETGKLKPEYEAAAEEQAAREREAENAYYTQIREEEGLAEQIAEADREERMRRERDRQDEGW